MAKHAYFLRQLGVTIRYYRLQAGISQEALAERAGITRRFIQELENGRSDISLGTLMRMAQALEVELSELCRKFESEIKAAC